MANHGLRLEPMSTGLGWSVVAFSHSDPGTFIHMQKDENVIPPPGQPFYAPFKASYPTKGRITEVMNVLNTMGARLIRSQTMGVSVGNPLSLMPALGKYNEEGW